MNLTDPLARWAAREPAKAALVTPSETVTFAELAERTDRLAAGLRARGLREGDPVALFLPTGVPSVVATIALLKAGMVYVGLNVMLRAKEVRDIVANADCKAILVAEELREVVAEACRELPMIEHVIVVGAGEEGGYEQLLERPAQGGPSRSVAADDLAALFYTGGTTGAPKGAMHSHRTLLSWMEIVAPRVALTPADRAIAMIPTFIGGAFMVATWAPLAAGATVYLSERFDPAEAVDLMEAEKVTFTWGSIGVIQRINELPGDADLSAMTRSVWGGYSHPTAMRREFEARFGARAFHAWGMSETVGTVILQPPEDNDARQPERRYASVGLPVAGVEAAILDDDGAELPPGEPGELCLRSVEGGGWLPFLGYYNDAEASARAFASGQLHTNDLATIDADGWVTVEGRRGDLIKVSGWSVYATELEEFIAGDERVREVAVVGVSDPRSGQRPVAFLTVKEGAELSGDDICERVSTGLANFKRLKQAIVVPELPKNYYGKILKQKLDLEQVR
ncbi:MAG: class I adenylate-forming enzyme family protein [Solirubrobacterales bacterium]